MYYGGYDQGYAGDQAHGSYTNDNGAQDYTYQQQQMMMQYQGSGGYDQYGQQQQQQPMQEPYAQQQQMMGGNAGYQADDYEDGGEDERGGALKSVKSFSGPPPGVVRKQSTMTRNRSVASRSNHNGTGMARHGSVFFGARERDTQVAISTRGGMSVRGMQDEEETELKQYYGDMAARNEERKMDGLKAVRSYRGDIEEGEDVGKPRRVTNRRNVDGRSATGYGGINFKRKAAMRNGEQWGDVEVRRKAGNGNRSRDFEMEDANRQPPPMPQQPPMQGGMDMYGGNMYMAPVVFEEAPAVPQIFNQEDVHSYSNLSDAFAEAAAGDQEDADF